MVAATFRSRVHELAQKCRKALRLYTSMRRMNHSEQSELTEQQIAIWRDVNADLLRHLSSALENDNSKALASDLYVVSDRFYHKWRDTESELHLKRRDLLLATENGDFVKATLLSRELVGLKAQLEASQAAHHELAEVLEKSKVSRPSSGGAVANQSHDVSDMRGQQSLQVDFGEFGLGASKRDSLTSVLEDEHLQSEEGYSEQGYEESSSAKVIELKRWRQ